jgi:hypothetical protein
MAIITGWCPVLQENVTRITTFEGEVTTVVCPEFEPHTKGCRLKKAAGLGGPLSQLLDASPRARSPIPNPVATSRKWLPLTRTRRIGHKRRSSTAYRPVWCMRLAAGIQAVDTLATLDVARQRPNAHTCGAFAPWSRTS